MCSGSYFNENLLKIDVVYGTIDNNLTIINSFFPKVNFNIITSDLEIIPEYFKFFNFICNKITYTDLKNYYIQNRNLWEKNWCFFNYKNSLHIVYKWYPLHICKLNNDNNLLELIEIKNMPDIFIFTRGSTNGFEFDNKIYFIIHKVNYFLNYYHMLVIFDLNMNLIAYVDQFKIENEGTEFCMGIIVTNDTIILSYSTSDKNTKISIYDKKYIENLLIYV